MTAALSVRFPSDNVVGLLILGLDKCAVPSGVARLMRHRIAQTAVDIIGDLLSKF